RRSEAHFRALIEKASDLILVATRAGDLVYASPSSVRVLGISPDDLIGRSIHGAVHPDDAPLVDAFFSENSLAPGAMQPFEWRFLHSDGSSRILEGLASNLAEDDSVGGIVMNARDVSEKRQAEQALRE